MKYSLVVLAVLSLIAGQLLGQDARGSVSGRVSDAGGANVGGAEVRAVNTATGVPASAKTNDAGLYTLPFLTPGMYRVSVEVTGFKKFLQEVQVRIGDAVPLEISLTVGNVSEIMEVKAETPLLSTGESSLGQVVDERRIQELPLFAGNAMDLVHLAPGTVNGTNLRLRKAPFNSAPSQFSSDGGGNNSNDFTIDGVANVYSDGTAPRVAFSPPQTSIGEFRIQTATFDAQAGFTIGSVVNVNTKGGTNELHGELHWWIRNSALDSKTVFQNRNGQKLPVYQDNRYGISGGGPVILPKIYNGKNKTFWFFAFEGNKFGDPNVGPGVNTVPTDAYRRGDLSKLLPLGAAYQVYDPATTTAVAGGRFQRQPFPNNIIPTNRLDPVALNLLKFYPGPNQPGTRDDLQNYFTNTKALEDYWTTIGRVDHAFNDKHRLFVRWHRDYWQEDKNRTFPNDVTGIILNRINRGIALDDVYVITPALLLNVRYGLTAQEFPERRISRGFDLASLGFSSSLVSQVDKGLATFPRLNVAPLTQLSNWESGDGTTTSLIHNPVVSLTWLRGKHSLKFGGDFRNIREFRNRFPSDVSPDLFYDANFTRGPLDSNANPTVGGQLASFLLGIPGGSMARTASYAEQNTIYGFYVQDDYKLSKKLTLNLGLRYEYESPITERYNRSVSNFAYDQSSPVEAAARANYALNPIPEISVANFRVLGGLTYAGVGGNPEQLWKGDKNNWMPRVGFAYQLAPKTVLRGGYGLFYGPLGTLYTNTIQTGFSQSTPIQASLDNGLTFVATNANPFPGGLTPAAGAAGGLRTNLGQGLSFFDPSRKNPYAQRFSFGIQQQLPGRFLIEASYVGNRGTQLNLNRNINATPLNVLSTSPTRDQPQINYLAQQFRNPFAGTAPIYGQNIARSALLRPYPQFGDIIRIEPTGYSWYHALQMRFEKRLGSGFSFQSSYTWSKAMQATEFLNDGATAPSEVISDLDRPHRLTGSGIWELPFGRGRRFGATMPKALEFFAGGWQLNGLMQTQSGQALGFGNAIFNGDLKNLALASDQRGVDRWFNTAAGFERNNALQLASNLRALSLRFAALRGPGQNRWDFSLIKNFRVTERIRTQFRAETYNALNHVNLSNPNTTPTSTAFGTITGQDPPKSWQFALKINF